MTNLELKERFEVAGKTARDFIRWAKAETGVVFSDSEVSEWLGGKRPRRLTKAPIALFTLFLNYTTHQTALKG